MPDWYGPWWENGELSLRSERISIGEPARNPSTMPMPALVSMKAACPITTPGLPVSRP